MKAVQIEKVNLFKTLKYKFVIGLLSNYSIQLKTNNNNKPVSEK